MPKAKNSPAKGTHCDRCGFITDIANRRLIRAIKYERDTTRPSITTHNSKIIHSIGLCKACYKEYEEFVKTFVKF